MSRYRSVHRCKSTSLDWFEHTSIGIFNHRHEKTESDLKKKQQTLICRFKSILIDILSYIIFQLIDINGS